MTFRYPVIPPLKVAWGREDVLDLLRVANMALRGRAKDKVSGGSKGRHGKRFVSEARRLIDCCKRLLSTYHLYLFIISIYMGIINYDVILWGFASYPV